MASSVCRAVIQTGAKCVLVLHEYTAWHTSTDYNPRPPDCLIMSFVLFSTVYNCTCILKALLFYHKVEQYSKRKEKLGTPEAEANVHMLCMRCAFIRAAQAC